MTTLDLTGFVRKDLDGASRLDLAVEGVTCAACIGEIEQAMLALAFIETARLNYTSSRLSLSWRDEAFTAARAVEKLRTMGYKAHPFELAEREAQETAQSRKLLLCLGVAGFATMNVMLLSISVWAGHASDMDNETRDLFHWISALIAAPAVFFAGRPFFSSAAGALKRRSLNMDVPISLGILLAVGMSLVETALSAANAYFDSALMLIFFLLAGRYMEQSMRTRMRASAGNLAALRVLLATRVEPDGALQQVPANRLAVDDIALILPGERAPADGRVIAGASDIEESFITGETTLRAVAQGDIVHAGALNHSGTLRIKIFAPAENSLLNEIERLIEKAAGERSGYVGLAERAARIYAPMVHLTAAATLIGWLLVGASFHNAVIIAIAVLIITCPCALALAVPAIQVVASGALYRAGVLLNGGQAIERLSEADVIIFDKTGTLTLPEPGVANREDIAPDLLKVAARLARSSRHPLARAVAQSEPFGAPYDNAQEIVGEGVYASIDGEPAFLGSAPFCSVIERLQNDRSATSHIYFRLGERSVCFEVTQTLRPDAAETVERLRARGYRLEILSGDNARATSEIAQRLGIEQWRASASPAEKLARLEYHKRAGAKVLMIGDGVNDAPALAAAYVSMSPVSASDLAQAAADAVFLGDNLAPVAQSLRVARRARRLMRENLGLAIIYNIVAAPLAVLGYVTPLIAAIAMSGSSLIVTANALRAARGAPNPRTSEANPRPRAESRI